MSTKPPLRSTVLAEVRRVVAKVGSAVLTDERGLDRRSIIRLAGQLAELHGRGMDVVLVSSGAVAAGRRRLSEMGNGACTQTDLPARQALSALGQGRLMHDYDEAFAWFGKASAQVLLTREGLRQRDRFLNARNTLERLLQWRVIPIINENDTVSVRELEFGDNDTLASMCVGLVGADLFINLTSADGVYDKNPHIHADAKPIRTIDDIAGLDIEAMCDGKTDAGTGGMYSKLRAARRAAQLGVPTLIVSGRGEFSLQAAMADDGPGTLVLPDKNPVSCKKFWLAYHDNPAGTIVVDAGAARALTEQGKSLLPIGIREVEGEFERGALVHIRAKTGETLGLGLSNFSSDELCSIQGRRSNEIADVLGQDTFTEAVHRDNLLLDPAL